MDSIERGQRLDEFYRRNAIAAHFASAAGPEEPLYIDGERCCLDCEDPIPPDRLRHRPDAVRCTECQSKKERLWKR